ncbi:hypothetical protein J6590_090007 [Homalodisca vitripennis]|nr:hypothetical protein J6590_090007 [Homalodisca vitripennis]
MDEPNQEIEDDEPLFGDDDSDADQDYLPEDPADDPEEENVNAEPLIEELPANAIPPPNQTGKKRIRRQGYMETK